MSEQTSTKTTDQVAINSTPEDNGGKGSERLFTQEEVNKIISERLARDRADRGSNSDSNEDLSRREQDLQSREARLTCLEYVKAHDLDPALLEVFDTNDAKAFQKRVDTLLKAYPQIDPAVKKDLPRFTGPVGESKFINDPIAEAFRRK